MKTKKLVLFGDSAFAEVAYEYFTHDSEYEVVAFTINREYIKKDSLFGLPIVAFEDVVDLYPPATHEMHIALVYNQLNRIRKRVYEEAKAKGFTLASYISSKAFVWRNVTWGDNVFVFEDNTIQPFVKMGSNLVLWSGNHIGHHSQLKSHSFISSHVVISGFCTVGESCFMGVNSTVGNNIAIGDDCLIGSGALIVKNVPDRTLVKGTPAPWDTQNTHEKFGINE